jgi:glycosidase
MKVVFRLLIALFLCSAFISPISAQPKLYPNNWWVNMKWNKVQILVHTDQASLATTQVKLTYAGVKLAKVNRLENNHYLALDLTIAPTAKPGDVKIQFTTNGSTQTVVWPLLSRRTGKGTTYAQGVTSEDFIYLLMPDRFSNGDPSNDRIAGLRDQTLNRDSIYHRHGGDLQGIINHLDYLQDLGVTSVWPTPVLQNDMPSRTEHGYAFTDHYTIEPRFGGAAAYLKFSDALHQRGMKLIQDAVYNHVGSYHFTVLDPPMKDWLHQWPSFTQTTYKDQSAMDPYAARKDSKLLFDGWFVPSMPDLNQNNPYVANFLIQHALWSVETFGVDGWRIDTYIYNDLPFMNRCNKALMDEYPKMTMFGETWVHGTLNQAYFADNNLNIPFKSNLPGVTDFQTNLYGIAKAVNEPFGWTEGVNKLYTTLSNDFVYKNPMRNVNFLDNHDMTRFFTQVNENLNKQKTGLMWLLTCRGIPQLYYGTEVLMKGNTYPADGWVRLDFPGGWNGDGKNAFTGAGLTREEAEIQALTKKFANFRKKSSAIKTGKMMQYVPNNGLYVYFRYDQNQTVMCVMNTDTKERAIDFNAYDERTKGFSSGVDVLTDINLPFNAPLKIGAQSMMVMELKK